jgi:peptide/nickel transport system permease protein
MQQYILRRVLLFIPTVFLIITLVFLFSQARTDYATQKVAGGSTSGNVDDFKAQLERTRKQLRLDGPAFPIGVEASPPFVKFQGNSRYVRYLGDVARGDFGNSYLTNRPVTSELVDRLPASLELGIFQLAIGVTLAIPIAVISAIRQDSWLDYVLRIFAILGLAIPVFFLGPLLLLVTYRWLNWTPPLASTAYREIWQDPIQNLKMLALPALAGGVAEAAVIMRLLRSQMLEVLRQDYVRTAWAKGLRERSVVIRHALRNALVPVVTVLGLSIGTLFGGNVVLEGIFSVPGAGRFIVIAFGQNDYPMVQGFVLIVGMALVTTNLVVDLAYAWLDPRIRYG